MYLTATETLTLRNALLRCGACQAFVLDLCTRPREQVDLALQSLGQRWSDIESIAAPDVDYVCNGSWVMDALEEFIEGETPAVVDPDVGADWTLKAPRFYSGVDAIDDAYALYGVVAFGGAAGAGKSMLAASAAVTTALQRPAPGSFPPRVFYMAAEMDSREILGRLMRVGDGIAAKHIGMNLHPLLTFDTKRSRLDLRGVCDQIMSKVHIADGQVLLVVDSLNTLAEQMGGEYWDAMRDLQSMMLTLRRRTQGRFAALCISELNKAGELQGRKVEYAADMVFRFSPGPTPDDVEIECTKGRSGGRRKYGTFRIEWGHGHFARIA